MKIMQRRNIYLRKFILIAHYTVNFVLVSWSLARDVTVSSSSPYHYERLGEGGAKRHKVVLNGIAYIIKGSKMLFKKRFQLCAVYNAEFEQTNIR